MCYKLPRALRAHRIVVLAAVFSSSLLSGLNAQEEEVFELSPFVVDGSDDVGYSSPNSNSATRLNERIKVLPVSIETINSDLMEDLAINNVSEALELAAGVVVEDDGNQRSTTFRGLTSRFQRRNQFVWYNPTDNFSTDRVEVIRGPQSLLYGQAEPGGLVNTITKQGVYGNTFQKIQTRVDNNGGSRITTDLNYGELLEDGKLAIRVAGLLEDGESWRVHDDKDREGIFFALGSKLTENLELRLEYEDAEIEERAIAGGIEDFNAPGEDDIEIIDAVFNGEPLLGTLIDRDELGAWNGLDNNRTRSWSNKNVTLEGSLFDKSLNYQLTWNEQWQEQDIHRVFGGNNIDYDTYVLDPTEAVLLAPEGFDRTPTTLSDGRLEYAEDFFVTLGRQWEINGNTVTNKRATFSYEFEPFETKQNLIAGFDNRVDSFFLFNENEVAGGNNLEYYVPVRKGQHGFSVADDLSLPNAGAERLDFIAFENIEETDSVFVALSSKFLNDKLHTLIGWRNDDFEKVERSTFNTTAVNFDDDPDNDTPFNLVDADSVDSYNAGFNYSFNYNWSVYGNYSESFKAAGASRRTPYGDFLGAALGEGTEFGVKWDSEDRKYSGTVSYYSTDFSGDQVRLGNSERDLISAVRAPGTSGGQNRNLGGRPGGWRWISADTQSEGVEFQMTANPNENWSMKFGYAYIIDAGFAQDFGLQAIYNDHFIVGADGNPAQGNGNPIIIGGEQVLIEDVEFSADGRYVLNSQALKLVRTPEREFEGGSPVNPYTGQEMPFVALALNGDQNSYAKHSVNFTAKYKFTEGRFKGVNVGANIRGRYDNLAGYDGSIAAGNRTLRNNPDYTTVGFFINYWKKLGNVGWSTQLNVNNAFNESYFGSGFKGFYFPDRTFIWSNNFNF